MEKEKCKKNSIQTKGWLVSAIAVFVVLIPIFFTNSIYADMDEAVSNADFVLAIDCSGSMIDNDQQLLTVKAAKYFISQLPLDKARLAIIVFGNDYAPNHYDGSWNDQESGTRVKVAYELTEIDSKETREAALEAIDKEVNRDGELTPIGYALEAAVRVLDEGNPNKEKGKAGIVLITDGQVEGQNDFYNNDKLDYRSIDSAVNHAAAFEWPVYCFELNYLHENRPDSDKVGPRIACHQMRENIPSKTGTEPIELTSADQAKKEMVKILKKFFDPDSPIKTIDGEKEETIGIYDMVAEQNINILGDMSKVTSIELISPDGIKDIYYNEPKELSLDDRVIYFDESAALIKLLMPDEGDWKVLVHTNGEANISFDLITIAIREMDLNLQSTAMSGEIDQGTAVEFAAGFSYKGTSYKAEQFYARTQERAYLVIEGAQNDIIKMTADGSVYKADYQFIQNGSYTAYAVVEFPNLPEKEKRSIQEYHYAIETKETVIKGSVPDQELDAGGDSLMLDMTAFFENPEGRGLIYSVELDKGERDGDLSYEIDDKGLLNLTSGQRSGSYVLKVGASDGMGESEVWQTINVSVKNKDIQALGDKLDIDVQLVSDGKDGYTFPFNEHFKDEDDAPMEVYVYDVTKQDAPRLIGKSTQSYAGEAEIEDSEVDNLCYIISCNRDEVTIKGKEIGKVEINIQAVDGNAPDVFAVKLLHVSVISPFEAIWQKNKIAFILTGLCAFVVTVGTFIWLSGRKVYGRWRIEFPDRDQNAYPLENNNSFEIFRLKHCHGGSVTIDSILKDIGREGRFGREVKLVAGDKWSKDVYLKGISYLESCEADGGFVDVDKEKKFKIKQNYGTVTIRSKNNTDGNHLTLIRVK